MRRGGGGKGGMRWMMDDGRWMTPTRTSSFSLQPSDIKKNSSHPNATTERLPEREELHVNLPMGCRSDPAKTNY